MIEVNEYVRTNKGVIGELISETLSYPEPSEWILKANNNKIVIVECNDYPVKHSKQLIDLIEAGDYVNGYRILAIEDSIYKNSKRILIYKNQKEKYERWIYIQEYDGKIHTQDDLVEILTKESYMANCYKVGGEDE
jgi:hypothetical protein